MNMNENKKTFKEVPVEKLAKHGLLMNEMNTDAQRKLNNLAEKGRMQEQHRLMCELAEGRKSGEKEGWIPSEDVREHFRVRANAK